MALNSQLRKIRYRVSVHGTAKQILQIDTAGPCTDLPCFGARLHREVIHTATAISYTEAGDVTAAPYTSERGKALKLQFVSQGNCTKPSYMNHNNKDVVLWLGGPVE
jgi:hypothetical protein